MLDRHHLRLGASIGGAVYPSDGADANTLITNADATLYRAKAEARGSVLMFTPRSAHNCASAALCKKIFEQRLTAVNCLSITNHKREFPVR